MAKAQAPGPHAGRLSSWGIPDLDEMAVARREPKQKEVSAIGCCPSCKRYRKLFMVYAATICQECHDGIDALVEKSKGGWKCFNEAAAATPLSAANSPGAAR